jgi:hypothetical protein
MRKALRPVRQFERFMVSSIAARNANAGAPSG